MSMNIIEENLQKYQLIQDDKNYILSTSLIGKNLKISCYENYHEDSGYSSIFTIEQLKGADPIFQIAQDCEDVQWIFEEVILAQSVGILENNGTLDVYFYMRANGRASKVILRLNRQRPKNNIQPFKIKNYSNNEERLSRLQSRANELLNEQNALRRQLNSFLEESYLDNNKENKIRSRSTNQNNYHNKLNDCNISNNFINYNQTQNQNTITNLNRIQVTDDDNEVYEFPSNDK